MQGLIGVYKPRGITSNAVLSKIKKQFNINKIGHMGTLDPLAEGVLPVAFGKATRMFDYFLEKTKTYVATFEFGYETTTLDVLGESTKFKDCSININEINKELSKFIGKIKQMPPDYSAKSINGTKAYKLARENKSFKLKQCDVEVFEFKVLKKIKANVFEFLITCSSGTYVRSLARDLGYALNTFGTMTKLIRTKCGVFNVNTVVGLDELLNGRLEDYIMDVYSVFPLIEKVHVADADYFKLINGVKIKADKFFIGNRFVICKNSLIGVGFCDAENNIKIKTNLME